MFRFYFLIGFLFSSNASSQTGEQVMRESPVLYNGTRSIPGEFLPIGFIGNCTGTAVARDVVYTAAHCVSTGKIIQFTSRFDNKRYQARCTNHPQYNNRTVLNDWAFCKLTSGQFPADMPLATLVEQTPAVGERLLLNGYGAPTVGTHHWGSAPMHSVRGQDIVTCNPVSLGGGDSGGSLLRWTTDRSGRSGFEVVGVNSRRQVGGNCSYFNRLSDSRFGTFARSYQTSQNVKLCGIGASCGGVLPPPPIEPEPPVNCWQVYEELNFCIGTKSIAGCIRRAEQLLACVR